MPSRRDFQDEFGAEGVSSQTLQPTDCTFDADAGAV